MRVPSEPFSVTVTILSIPLTQLRGVITTQRLSVASNAIDHPSLGHSNNNNNAVHNTNLNLHMHTFYENKPSATVTDLYAEADKVISLSKTNGGNGGLGKRAGPERGEPRSQQRDTSFKQRPYDGKTQSRKRDTFAKKRPNQDKSEKDVVCSKCQNKGHTVAKCKSVYTKSGKYIGKGEPPAGHYWTC